MASNPSAYGPWTMDMPYPARNDSAGEAVGRSKPTPIAPATADKSMSPPGLPIGAHTMPYTCQTCTRRKVKCDKVSPICSSCRKSHLDCSYQAPPPRKKKRQNSSDDLQDRLNRAEELLKANGIPTPDSSSSGRGRTADSRPEASERRPGSQSSINPILAEHGGAPKPGRLLSGSGKTRYIDSNLWRNVGEEDFAESSDEEDGKAVTGSHSTHDTPSDPISAAFLSPGMPAQDLSSYHPSHSTAMKFWEAYQRNVEPITKVFHVPSMDRKLREGSQSPSTLSRADEALFFSLYHFAATVMEEEECIVAAGVSKATLMSHYEAATRQALVNAHFLKTAELAVVQAYTIFLLAYRPRADPSILWILTGVAMRLAQRLGIHRDGEVLGLPPYDTELRRRLWWQLLPLDGLAGQLSGSSPTASAETWDTKHPLNLNDADFDVDTTTMPSEREGATDMIFCLTRAQIGKWHQYLHKTLSKWRGTFNVDEYIMLEQSINELESTMESKFLRYLEMIKPLQFITHMMARTALASTRLRMRLPRIKHQKEVSAEDRLVVFELAMKILSYDCSAYETPGIKRFLWHIRSFFQSDALIWILHEIRDHHLSVAQCTEAWERISKVYANHPDLYTKKAPLSNASRRLTISAWEAHADLVKKDPAFACITEPEPITKLRSLSRGEQSSIVQQQFDSQPATMSAEPTPSFMWPPPPGGNALDPFSVNFSNNYSLDIDWMFFDTMNGENQNIMQNDNYMPTNWVQ